MGEFDVASLGTILSVWAHPDDEGYCCGAIMAAALDAGQRVVCVTATRGELGSTDEQRWPPGAALAEVRTKELAASLAELGVTEHHWLDYPDGGCADVDDDEAAARLRAIIDDVRPDTILTFGPDGATWHPDHIAVSRWCHLATRGTAVRVFNQTNTPEWLERMSSVIPIEMVMMDDREPVSFSSDECSLLVNFDGDALERKYRAMMCQLSQIEPLLALVGPDGYRRMLAEEAFTDNRW